MNRRSRNIYRASPLKFIVLLGIVSLFADMTYEGARSITGPYLGLLGAGAATVAIVSGFGEFVGYALRLVSGYISDRTRQYWTITIIGYVINLLAVPLLAFAGRWELAAALIVAERFGKAVRTPARDTMLSYAASGKGLGKGFGIHEALDQIGAILGPMIVSIVFFFGGEYRTSFLILLIPALIALIVLCIARWYHGQPGDMEPESRGNSTQTYGRTFWIYVAGASCFAAGFVDFPLAAFHFDSTGVVPHVWIPTLYALAMGVDAVAALALGWSFDRHGSRILVFVVVISSLSVPLLFLGKTVGVLFGMVFWGIGLGAQESVIRASVARLTAKNVRGTAFGIFHTCFGLAWLLGSVAIGIMYDISLPLLIVFSVVFQLLAVPFFIAVGRFKQSSI